MQSDDVEQIRKDLSNFLESQEVKPAIQRAVGEIRATLSENDGSETASISITAEQLPGIEFPEFGQLIRVYGARAGNKGKVERHPNSFQSMKTVQGNAITRVFDAKGNYVDQITDAASDEMNKWSFVQENTWHQPIAGNENWIAVTFHSSPADSLIDEYK